MRVLLWISFPLALLLAPTTAAAQGQPPGFKATSLAPVPGGGDVAECHMDGQVLRCLLYGAEAEGASCDAGGPVLRMTLPPKGPARRDHACVDEAFHGWRELGRNRSWDHESFHCGRYYAAAPGVVGASDVVRCVNASDRGFTLDGHGTTRLVSRAFRKRVAATPRRGVVSVAGLPIAGVPRSMRRSVTSNEVDARIGPADSYDAVPGRCHSRWSDGLEMVFASFAGDTRCRRLKLQEATLSGEGWRVRVGRRVYRTGDSAARISSNARRYRRWDGAFALASMPFAGGRTPAVLAHVSKGRIDRFFLFIGGAGD
ncbi:MAG TPA: hypothetical protein VHF88_05380 [Thermoleophilaceae bacterium]|nr:hypothetical protein [Thermoleophilaceae bacterium]